MILRLILAITIFTASSAFAKSEVLKTSGDFVTKKQFENQLKQMKTERSKKRKIANTDRVDYGSIFEDDFKNLSSELIGGKTWEEGKPGPKISGIGESSEALAKVVEKYDRVYEELSPQAKWVTIQLASLKPMRGIVSRLKPFLKNSDSPFLHAFVVTWIRSIYAGVSSFNPNSEWDAGLDYLVKPYKGMKKDIKTELDLYNFVKNEVLPNLEVVNRRARDFVYNGAELDENFTPFYFDNKLLYSSMNVVDQRDRFVVIDKGEVHSAISNVNFSISSLRYGLAYDWTGLLNTINKVAINYGFKNLFKARPDRMTAEKRIKSIKNNKGLFRLIGAKANLTNGGVTWTKSAFPYFKEGVRQGRLAWSFTKDYRVNGNSRRPLLDPRSFLPFERIIDTSFDSVADLIDGEGVRSSMVQGELVKVNFQKFFDDPPTDMKDFLAVGFIGGKKTLTEKTTKKEYRNYKYGNPEKWNLEAYKKYFPEIDQQGVPNAARILGQTWGGNILGATFFPVLF